MIPVERWHCAISVRHSTRKFNGQDVDPSSLSQLEELCRKFRPSQSVRAELVTKPGSSIFRGIVGGYGKITGAPCYAAFIGMTKASDVHEMIGYLGEAVILEATALGLATCWNGGAFRPEAVARDLVLAPGEKVFAVTPIGYPLQGKEKLMRVLSRGDRRKELDKLVSGLGQEKWPPWVRAGLEAARLAPSTVNRQPWRFQVLSDGVLLTTDGKINLISISRRLDCGIAMLHFELGAMSAGVRLNKELLKNPGVAVLHRLEMEMNSKREGFARAGKELIRMNCSGGVDFEQSKS